MKKSLLALTLLAGLSSVVYAAVPNTGVVGVRGGYAFTSSDGSTTSADTKNVQMDSESGFAYGVYFGYNFTSWLGVEAGFTEISGLSVHDTTTNDKLDVKLRGPELALRLAYPLDTKGTDVFLKAGGMYAVSNADGTEVNRTFAPLVGVGAQYVFENGIGLRVGYDHYFGVVDNYTTGNLSYPQLDTDLGIGYVGLQYSFGGKPAPAPEPTRTVVSKSFALDSDTLFAFDKATLSAQGEESVAKVVNDVRSANLKSVSYQVTGHTDRLGPDAYNQKLSEQRANAVVNSLVNNGVDGQTITSQGVGKAQSVTGNKCDGLAGKELVNCLAPDRRVEIAVSGVQESVEVK